MPTPKGSERPRVRLNNGPVSADGKSMTTTRTALQITRPQAAALLAGPAALLVLDLGTGATTLSPVADEQVWSDPTRLVLATHDDAIAAASEAAGHADFLGRLTRILNLDLHALAAAGEIPTAEEIAAVLAELDQYEAELAQVIAFPGGAA